MYLVEFYSIIVVLCVLLLYLRCYSEEKKYLVL